MSLLDYSTYLQRLLRVTSRSDWVSEPSSAVKSLDEILKYLALEPTDKMQLDYRNWADVGQYLGEQKRLFSLALAITDLYGHLTTEEIGRKQSLFAELTLDLALRAAWHQPQVTKLCRGLPEPGQPVPGLTILGLGKLGGRDLNFSSDIDLLAFYEPEKLPMLPMEGAGDLCSRILKLVTQLLSGHLGGELIWRVDWRLRPEASATQIAMSTEAALNYYFFRALPWHRLALMKARVVAGDKECGQQLLRELDPFIWRQNLDFRAIDDIAQLKTRIDLEHPQLSSHRAKQSDSINSPSSAIGFNLKLGNGGIREIEFIANAMQLIWGGKNPQLRTGHSLTALRLLADFGLLDPNCGQRLIQNYLWLRKLENRLQMIDNQQAHTIPAFPEKLSSFQALNEISDWKVFEQRLLTCRTQVNSNFNQLFRDQQGKGKEQARDHTLDIAQDLSQSSRDILLNWREGFRAYGATEFQSQKLKALYPLIVEQLLETKIEADKAIEQLHIFFKGLPPGGQYFSLLLSSPKLLEALVVPVIYSPPMRSLLAQSPHIMDSLLAGDRLEQKSIEDAGNEAIDASWVKYKASYEVRLERLRRLVNENLYTNYLEFLGGELKVQQLQRALTILAEQSVSLGTEVVAEELYSESTGTASSETGRLPEFSLYGLGKLGMQRMAPLSDLDIIYIYSDNCSREQSTTFVSRLQTALSARMKEGIAYEMDTKLRPSGLSGAVALSVSSFASYQGSRAKTWEHIALVSARHVLGHGETGKFISQTRYAVLSRKRNTEQFRMDAAKMLERIRDQRIVKVADSVVNTKLRPGGLMEAEYLAACCLIRLAPEHPELLSLDYSDMLKQLALLSAKSNESHLRGLPNWIEFWSVLQIWERLLGLEGSEIDDIPQKFLPRILTQLNLDSSNQLIDQMREVSLLVRSGLEQEFSGVSPQDLKSWQEKPVLWLD